MPDLSSLMAGLGGSGGGMPQPPAPPADPETAYANQLQQLQVGICIVVASSQMMSLCRVPSPPSVHGLKTPDAGLWS